MIKDRLTMEKEEGLIKLNYTLMRKKVNVYSVSIGDTHHNVISDCYWRNPPCVSHVSVTGLDQLQEFLGEATFLNNFWFLERIEE